MGANYLISQRGRLLAVGTNAVLSKIERKCKANTKPSLNKKA